MIVFAAIAPHSPLLLPTIGKEHQEKLSRTLASYRTLAEDLYAAKPDTIVVLTPHGSTLPDAFALFIAQSYNANLKEFGDFQTALTFKADLRLIETLRQMTRPARAGLHLVGITDEFVDYGVTVPLYFLASHLPAIRVVALGDARLALAKHFKMGQALGDTLHQSTRRVALLASADLAHTLTDEAPGGFSPAGKLFDEAVVQALRKKQTAAIIKLEQQMFAAKACGLRVIVMLLGAVDELNYTTEPLSYEGPFGVGYLTARFQLY